MIYKFIVLGTLITRRVAHMMKSMKLQPLMPIDIWGRGFDGLNCTVYTELSNKLEDVIIWVKLPLPVPFFSLNIICMICSTIACFIILLHWHRTVLRFDATSFDTTLVL